MDVEEVKARWSEYIADLFSDERTDASEIGIDDGEESMIMKFEVRAAKTSMKRGKAVGDDGRDVVVIQALGNFAVDQFTSLFQKIYETGNVVESLCESVFISLPKVEGTLECSKHRTLSIKSRITKRKAQPMLYLHYVPRYYRDCYLYQTSLNVLSSRLIFSV